MHFYLLTVVSLLSFFKLMSQRFFEYLHEEFNYSSIIQKIAVSPSVPLGDQFSICATTA